MPDAILDELNKRKVLTDMWKEMSGEAYIDRDYVSCAKNGLPHATSSFNTALTKLCKRNGLPHLTVHSLRSYVCDDLDGTGRATGKGKRPAGAQLYPYDV